MRKLIVLLAVLGLALIAVPSAQATETIQFASVTGASISINATDVGVAVGTFSFVPGTAGADFMITLSTLGTANNDLGYITNPAGGFVIDGPITNEAGGAQISTVSGMGSLTIIDKALATFTATLEWVKIETNNAGTIGSLNDQLVANIGSIVYTGSEADLIILANAFMDGGLISFQTGGTFNNPVTLTDLTNGNGETLNTSYSGNIVPVPPSVLLLGSGLLGLVGFRYRRSRKS